jgi:putative membrane protein
MAWHVGAGMGWWMLFGGLLWIAFWAMVIYLVVSLARRADSGERQPAGDPVEIAKRRYASGEIAKDEFNRIRHDLAT